MDEAAPQEPQETVLSTREIRVIYVPGADPIVHTTDEWTDWEMYAVLMRAAEMTADEEE